MVTGTFESFIGLYPVSKTLRFELIPQGVTAEKIREKGVLESDKKRAEAYKRAKTIIDEYHKDFIERALQNVYIDWADLAAAIDEYRKNKDDKSRQQLRKVQETKRKEIVTFFKAQHDFNKMFSEKLFSELLPDYLQKKNEPDEDIKIINSFNRFTTYFVGFHENRKNIYSSDAISTSIAFRIVHDNFPKFYSNIASFKAIQLNTPEIIATATKELHELIGEKPLSEWFEIDGFNLVLNQTGIDLYNAILGGYTKDNTNTKIRGINEFTNLFAQKNPEKALPKSVTRMSALYKQILSDRESFSFMVDQYEDDADVFNALIHFSDKIKQAHLFDRLHELMSTVQSFDLNRIYIKEKEINSVSHQLFDDWSFLTRCLREWKTKTENIDLKKKKNIEYLEKWLKSEAFSIADLDQAVSYAEAQNNGQEAMQFPRIIDYLSMTNELISNFNTIENKVATLINKRNTITKLQEASEITALIKSYLDSILNIYHHIKPFKVGSDLELDMGFYDEFNILYDVISTIVPIYNKVRNYVTRKPYRDEKYRLHFEKPTLADGWDKNKEEDNNCILLFKDGLYYLAIMNAKNKPKLEDGITKNTNNCYKKMVYKFFKDVTTMIPKCTTQLKSVKKHFESNTSDYIIEEDTFSESFPVSKEIFDLNNVLYNGNKKIQDAYLKETGDTQGYKHALTQWIEFCLRFLKTYKSTKDYDFSGIRNAADYTRLSDFYKDVNQRLYRITFEYLSCEAVDNWVKEGKLFLFQIYNKDFAPGATGRPNLHTMYWEGLFDPKNLENVVLKLDGQAELFYREASIFVPFRHKIGEKLVNKRTKDGRPIPDELYKEIFDYVNADCKPDLSEKAKALLPDVVIKNVSHEIIKDRRYTEDKFYFHVPITINFKADERRGGINNEVRAFLKNNSINVIGIDRGERNLLYATVIDPQGNILLQKSFNTIVNIDYATKLQHREKARDDARKNWNAIEGIKDLKEGYLSQVIHEISRMMIKYNAVIALEDLNSGFKRGRYKIERQVYQKFEKMLINKLNYLFFKDEDPLKPGGLFKGYQLTDKFTSFKELGKQCGFLFYVPAAYTSKIDPVTGFANVFDLRDLTNVQKKKEFFNQFDSIRYMPDMNLFCFSFDYKNFKVHQTCYKTKWTVFSNGKRIIWDPKLKTYKDIHPTEELSKLFDKYGISYQSGEELKNAIAEIDAVKANAPFFDALYSTFSRILQLRNTNSEEDYIISPVMSDSGIFFNSNEVEDGKLPVDADANGAYHIALKGLYLLRNIVAYADSSGQIKSNAIVIKNEDWFRFVQNQEYRK